MNLVHDFPPNIAEIRAVFGDLPEGVIFAYAPNIYVPSGTPLTPALKAHEAVHFRQQEEIGTEEWWRRYLDDEDFRLDQEIEAHRAELREAVRGLSRSDAARERVRIARRLTKPMYGSLVTLTEALALAVMWANDAGIARRS